MKNLKNDFLVQVFKNLTNLVFGPIFQPWPKRKIRPLYKQHFLGGNHALGYVYHGYDISG